ncbi:hypothetical protein PHYBLDRAFT_162221 [Phycomyces blakesleeanus NRRL 1555(-)]|uniref:Uncharacterized protein n=1 Tax=Phycomyces blakesleeanus (strain ATCC 8743b / DSM 1359 / FGSC 10004 / NBRC 33097 / NRRL 1555) TaxID=763407 RepID=A0A163BA08_PHYB8|nr:hypothetical protein PHYBLDRAFT_162221 [Phycomyces blakesleeanus NRRL 1555(-)]OAD79141.1 hypothetical protein PHYBLDRAFT_162221 [Phycomyces blakesleeanus NRRL 1555(-)]|eukprot:XP_018297181.1 hypothetical protein PHYBLDRAFT_162221 [Phycomyces blakesleeanus NRRL 1555(-)]
MRRYEWKATGLILSNGTTSYIRHFLEPTTTTTNDKNAMVLQRLVISIELNWFKGKKKKYGLRRLGLILMSLSDTGGSIRNDTIVSYLVRAIRLTFLEFAVKWDFDIYPVDYSNALTVKYQIWGSFAYCFPIYEELENSADRNCTNQSMEYLKE